MKGSTISVKCSAVAFNFSTCEIVYTTCEVKYRSGPVNCSTGVVRVSTIAVDQVHDRCIQVQYMYNQVHSGSVKYSSCLERGSTGALKGITIFQVSYVF